MGFQKLYDVQTFLENLRNHSRSGKRTWMPSLNCSPFADNFGANDTFSSSNNTDVSRKRLPLPSFPTELYSVGMCRLIQSFFFVFFNLCRNSCSWSVLGFEKCDIRCRKYGKKFFNARRETSPLEYLWER